MPKPTPNIHQLLLNHIQALTGVIGPAGQPAGRTPGSR
jgi:hypothetical protein